MKPLALPVLLIALAPTLAGCASTGGVQNRLEPAFLAYWQAGEGASHCPPSEECFSIRSSRSSFLELLEEQRGRGLEIVRFDAHVDGSGALYAGAWERSEQSHFLEMGMDWKRFSRRHGEHTEAGHRLIHLRVYRNGPRQSVAAVWRVPDPYDATLPPAKVVFHLTLDGLDEVNESMRHQGYHLAEFDVYPRLEDPEHHAVAAVFLPGKLKTRLHRVSGAACLPAADALRPVAAGREGGAPSACSALPHDEESEAPCPLAEDLQGFWAEGYRPVAFEIYAEEDGGRVVVLLHRGIPPGSWLMVPAVESAVECRHRDLNRPPAEGAAVQAAGFDLLDLDLVSLHPAEAPSGPVLSASPPSRSSRLTSRSGRTVPGSDLTIVIPGTPMHNGLIHDDGTSGPPP